jgi:hypothetical protein
MIDLAEFPMRVATFTLSSVPRGNLAKKESVAAVFHDLQAAALKQVGVPRWIMLATGLQVVVTVVEAGGGRLLVLELVRAITKATPRDVPKFGNEISALLSALSLSGRIVRSLIDDRRAQAGPCLRYLVLIAPKGGAA